MCQIYVSPLDEVHCKYGDCCPVYIDPQDPSKGYDNMTMYSVNQVHPLRTCPKESGANLTIDLYDVMPTVNMNPSYFN